MIVRWKVVLFIFVCMFLVAPSQGVYAYNLQEYYPLVVGNAFSYDTEAAGNGQVKLTPTFSVISSTELLSGVSVYHQSLGWKGQIPNIQEGYELKAWDAEGLKSYRLVEVADNGTPTTVYSTPRLLMPTSAELNQSVNITGGSLTVDGVEDVALPGGWFRDCLRLHTQTLNDGRTCDSYQWLAKWVGVVKSVKSCSGDNASYFNELKDGRTYNYILGYPFASGQTVSFKLATMQASGCEILINGIALAGSVDSYWARFVFDGTDLSFKLSSYGAGTQTLASGGTCSSVAGLDFANQPVMFLSDGNGFFTGLLLGQQRLSAQFTFSIQHLMFHLSKAWDAKGVQIYP
ncbi:MAG: hypothetical protein HQL06_08155 [Nitrospirae bacterium]|nr:hypothetical protein [Nitrospirota bacterium]